MKTSFWNLLLAFSVYPKVKTETKLAEKISAAAVFELATFGFKDHRANHYATSTVDFPYTPKSYRLTRELPETNEQNLLGRGSNQESLDSMSNALSTEPLETMVIPAVRG